MALNVNASRGGELAALESERQKGGSFNKIHYFPTMQDGEVIYVRPLTDQPDWITCKQHSRVATKNRPADWKGQNWPINMSASCREDKLFVGVYPPKSCYVCNEMVQQSGKSAGKKYTAPARTWGKFCLREEVKGTQEMVDANQIPANMVGKRVGFRDKTREVDEIGPDGKPTGNKIMEKAIVIANMGYQNFWSSFDGAYFASGSGPEDRTILNVDFLVRRRGLELDTDYQASPLPPIPGHDLRDKATAERYGDVVKAWNWDDNDPATHRWVISTEDIEGIIEERASDDYIATFFDPNAKLPASKSNSGDGQAAEAAKPNNDAGAGPEDPEKFQAMQTLVRGFSQAQQPEAQPAAAAPGGGMANFS